MSPIDFDGDFADEWGVFDDGYVGNVGVYGGDGVRPVINLKSDVEAFLNGTGEPGTSTNPYVIKTN